MAQWVPQGQTPQTLWGTTYEYLPDGGLAAPILVYPGSTEIVTGTDEFFVPVDPNNNSCTCQTAYKYLSYAWSDAKSTTSGNADHSQVVLKVRLPTANLTSITTPVTGVPLFKDVDPLTVAWNLTTPLKIDTNIHRKATYVKISPTPSKYWYMCLRGLLRYCPSPSDEFQGGPPTQPVHQSLQEIGLRDPKFFKDDSHWLRTVSRISADAYGSVLKVQDIRSQKLYLLRELCCAGDLPYDSWDLDGLADQIRALYPVIHHTAALTQITGYLPLRKAFVSWLPRQLDINDIVGAPQSCFADAARTQPLSDTYMVQQPHLILVYSFPKQGSWERLVENKPKKLTPQLIVKAFTQVLTTLQLTDAANRHFGSLHLKHMMLTSKYDTQLVDLMVTVDRDNKDSNFLATYAAPEFFLGSLSIESDVYSVALIFLQLLLHLYCGKKDKQANREIAESFNEELPAIIIARDSGNHTQLRKLVVDRHLALTSYFSRLPAHIECSLMVCCLVRMLGLEKDARPKVADILLHVGTAAQPNVGATDVTKPMSTLLPDTPLLETENRRQSDWPTWGQGMNGAINTFVPPLVVIGTFIYFIVYSNTNDVEKEAVYMQIVNVSFGLGVVFGSLWALLCLVFTFAWPLVYILYYLVEPVLVVQSFVMSHILNTAGYKLLSTVFALKGVADIISMFEMFPYIKYQLKYTKSMNSCLALTLQKYSCKTYLLLLVHLVVLLGFMYLGVAQFITLEDPAVHNAPKALVRIFFFLVLCALDKNVFLYVAVREKVALYTKAKVNVSWFHILSWVQQACTIQASSIALCSFGTVIGPTVAFVRDLSVGTKHVARTIKVIAFVRVALYDNEPCWIWVVICVAAMLEAIAFILSITIRWIIPILLKRNIAFMAAYERPLHWVLYNKSYKFWKDYGAEGIGIHLVMASFINSGCGLAGFLGFLYANQFIEVPLIGFICAYLSSRLTLELLEATEIAVDTAAEQRLIFEDPEVQEQYQECTAMIDDQVTAVQDQKRKARRRNHVAPAT